jgi:hypothetical protein
MARSYDLFENVSLDAKHDNIQFENLKIAFLVITCASQPNKQRAPKLSKMSLPKSGT